MSQVSDTKSKNQENYWKDSAARAEEFVWSKDEDNLRELGLKRSKKMEESTFFVTHLHKLTELTTSTFATRDGRVRRCMGEWCIHLSMIFGYVFGKVNTVNCEGGMLETLGKGEKLLGLRKPRNDEKLDAQNPSLAAFATRSAASWRLRDEARPRCRAPDEEGTIHAE